MPSRLRGARPVHVLAVTGIAAVTALALVAPSALAHNRDHGHGAVPPPPANPTSANQIQNVDQVKTAIKAYYGDTASTVHDPVDGSTTLHFASGTSAYAKEMAGIERDAARYLSHAKARGHHPRAQKAILLDVDDTTLNTFSYEIYSNFVYNPTSNAAFVNSGVFPAVPGMPSLVTWANSHGYAVFYLTGRPGTQQAGTVSNLQNVGYPTVDTSKLFLKDYTSDTWLSPCAPSCSTIQYKSLTRAHIESLGYDIVANFGDQYSDLSGGYADNTFKLPNPMYYLP
ncbi:MAG: HAD family acid phosphatase [Jatrophihabitantaceae bacterium]